MAANENEEAFLKKLRATFKTEAEEHLEGMATCILALETGLESREETECLDTLFRRAHSLKGASRAVNHSEVESVCQALETIFSAWKRNPGAAAPEDYDGVHEAIRAMEEMINSPADSGRVQLAPLAKRLDDVAIRSFPGAKEHTSKVGAISAEPPPTESKIAPTTTPIAVPPGVDAELITAAPSAPAPADLPPMTESVRIPVAKLDRVLLEAEEMLTVKLSIGQLAAEIRQVRSDLERWRSQWTRVQPTLKHVERQATGYRPQSGTEGATAELASFLAWNAAFVSGIESKLDTLRSRARHDEHLFGRLVDELLEDSKKLMMLPFSTITAFLPRMVREIGRAQGKEIDLVIKGKETELDKRLLEEMKDPLIHLVRNAIDHGIEAPEQRLQKQKPPRAAISISLSRINGNRVEIRVSDDGGGIDLVKVRQTAVRRGLLSTVEAEQLSEEELLLLIFKSDFSTSPIITELSGRGIGLAIVREKTEILGGAIRVANYSDAGTTFVLTLPITRTTVRALLVRVADQQFAIPTANVVRVGQTQPSEVSPIRNRSTISSGARTIPLGALSQVLQIENRSDPKNGQDVIKYVVLSSSLGQIAFEVEEIEDELEILVKALPRPLLRVRYFSGATLLPSGAVVPIIHVGDLIKSLHESDGMIGQAARAMPAPAEPKRILLAEDSITSRMLLKGILESAGYKVRTAVDGMDALIAARTEEFDLIVSDVEMPRMNGFDLTTQIRQDKKLADKPIVLVTALSSQADRERGIDVGANAYIVKSSLDQNDLLRVVQRLV